MTVSSAFIVRDLLFRGIESDTMRIERHVVGCCLLWRLEEAVYQHGRYEDAGRSTILVDVRIECKGCRCLGVAVSQGSKAQALPRILERKRRHPNNVLLFDFALRSPATPPGPVSLTVLPTVTRAVWLSERAGFRGDSGSPGLRYCRRPDIAEPASTSAGNFPSYPANDRRPSGHCISYISLESLLGIQSSSSARLRRCTDFHTQ